MKYDLRCFAFKMGLFANSPTCVCVCVYAQERMPTFNKLSAYISHRQGSGTPHLSETNVCRDPVSDRQTHNVSRNQVSCKQMLEFSFPYAAFERVKSKSIHVDIPFLCALINWSK